MPAASANQYLWRRGHGRIRVTLFDWLFVTQTWPLTIAIPCGYVPTCIGLPTTRPVVGLIRVTVESFTFTTQTAWSPTATAFTQPLTSVGLPISAPVLALIRVTV